MRQFSMVNFGIYDENEKLVGQYETMEDGLEALKELNDGEIHPYRNGGEGYYTEHYSLEKGVYSCVNYAVATLKFKDGAPIEPISSADLGIILSYAHWDDMTELYETLDPDKAREYYDSCEPEPIEFDKENRTIKVGYYWLETEDTLDGDMAFFYKCQAFDPSK